MKLDQRKQSMKHVTKIMMKYIKTMQEKQAQS